MSNSNYQYCKYLIEKKILVQWQMHYNLVLNKATNHTEKKVS